MMENENENADHPKFIKEFIDEPGDNCMMKSITFGTKGAVAGSFYGCLKAGYVEPAIPGMAGLGNAIRVILMNTAGFGAAAACLAGSTCLAIKLRDKDDHVSWAMGGGFTGALVGLRAGRIPLTLGLTAFGAIFMGTTRYCESHLKPMRHHTYRTY